MRKLILFLCICAPAWAGAVLALSGGVVNTAGTTVTFVVGGGGAGTLTPATGLLGMTVYLTIGGVKSYIAQTSATTSGIGSAGTVVVTVATPIQSSGETITADIASTTGANYLADGTNTAQGQTNLSVTNNSTTTGANVIPASASYIYLRGSIPSGTYYTRANALQIYGYYSRIEFKLTGTDASICQGDGGTIYVSVDGGAEVAKNGATTTLHWTWIPLYSGLSDTVHDVVIRNHNVAGNYIDGVHMLRVSGGTSPGCCTDIPGLDRDKYIVGTTPFTNSEQALSAMLGTTAQSLYVNCYYWQSPLGGIRFNAAMASNSQSISAWVYQNNYDLALYMDGVLQGTPAYVGTSAQFSEIVVGTAPDTNTHTWDLIPIGGGLKDLYQVFLPPGSTLGSAPRPRRLFTAYGDSIVYGGGLSTYPVDNRGVDYWLYGESPGWDFYDGGIGGTVVSHCGTCAQGSNYYLRDNTAQMLATLTLPTITMAEGGANDAAFSGYATPSTSGSTFTADFQTMLTNMAGHMQLGGAIYVRGITPNTANNYANRSAWEAAQATATANYNASPTNGVTAYFFSSDGWITAPGSDMTDAQHPSDAGYLKIRARELPIIQTLQLRNSIGWIN